MGIKFCKRLKYVNSYSSNQIILFLWKCREGLGNEVVAENAGSSATTVFSRNSEVVSNLSPLTDSFTFGNPKSQMGEPRLDFRTEAVNADIEQHPVDEVTESLQMQKELEMKGNTNQNHDPFSRHLPPELMSHIFAIYTDNFNSSVDIRAPCNRGGPLRLGAVSKLWREVAFSTPRLWNTINIQIYFPCNNIIPKIEITKQWLDRSRHLPLYLSLRITAAAERPLEPRLLGPLFGLIRNLAPRWHTLVLNIPPELYTLFIDDLTCAPLLHTLKFVDQIPQRGRFLLAQTPSLKYLEISTHFLSDIAIEWGNITHFQSDCLSIDEFFEILRLAGRLTSCRLRGISDHLDLHPIPTTPLTHLTLERLYLIPNDVYEDVMGDFFDLLVFPSLKRFGYGCTNTCPFPLNRLISLFNRSQCQLTHFELSGKLGEINMDDLIPLFSALPTITHLKLGDIKDRGDDSGNQGTMTDKLLQELTPAEGTRAVLFPYLQSLNFHGNQRFSWNCLADFIIARLTEDNNGSRNPIPDKMDVARNLPVLPRNKHSIRLVCLAIRNCEQPIGLDTRARLNFARDAGVSIAITDEKFFCGRHNLLTDPPFLTCDMNTY